MTLVPEVTLARERALCYACLAMVTDYDVWADRPVATKDIIGVMRANGEKMRRVLSKLLPRLGGPSQCDCRKALEDAGV
jgi:5'-methylthioadenosine phosphorylase